MTYKEKKDKIAELFNNYTAIKDEDINAIAEVYPLTAQAIYDVQKAAPEARIKVIAVTISKEILDSVGDNVDAAFIAIRNEVSKRFDNELTNLMMGQREFGNVAQANHIVGMTNNAFSNLVTALHQSAVSDVIHNELTYALDEITTGSGNKVVCPEICVAAIIKDNGPASDEQKWHTHFTDYAVATKLYDALQRMTHYDFKLAKRNAGIDLNELCAKYNDRAGSQMVIRDKANVELGINKRLVEYNDPVIAFDYSDEGYRAIGFIINCDHPDALLYLTCLHAVLVDYLYLGIEPESDYIRDYLFEHGQGFNNKDMFGYGYFSKPSDIIEAAAYADARDK